MFQYNSIASNRPTIGQRILEGIKDAESDGGSLLLSGLGWLAVLAVWTGRLREEAGVCAGTGAVARVLIGPQGCMRRGKTLRAL